MKARIRGSGGGTPAHQGGAAPEASAMMFAQRGSVAGNNGITHDDIVCYHCQEMGHYASNCAADKVTTPGMTSNHKRTTRNQDPLMTKADRMALPAAGAPACAGGSQICSGNNAVLASRPTVISAAAAQAIGPGRTRPDNSAISSVP